MSAVRGALPEVRRPLLRRLLAQSHLLRAIECHNPLSALLADTATVTAGGRRLQFDLLWASGFSHATAMGLPDAELALLERRLDTIADMTAVTAKPILADGDTGGDDMALRYLCRKLEAMGVSGVVVEDKTGAKRTSLAAGVKHELEDPEAFVRKIEYAKAGLLTADFMVFARIESLIAGVGPEDALARAQRYLHSGADGIVIHSKDRTGAEISAFLAGYRELQEKAGISKPLVCIPTAYNHMTGAQLHRQGASMVIHGNHLVRAACRGMQLAARSILENDRSLEADDLCTPVEELFAFIGVDEHSASRESVSSPEDRPSLNGRQHEQVYSVHGR